MYMPKLHNLIYAAHLRHTHKLSYSCKYYSLLTLAGASILYRLWEK